MLSFTEATRFVIERLNCSIGYAEKIVRDAYASGEVRWADDSLVNFNLRPGAIRGRPSAELVDLNREDFAGWLGRNHAASAPDPAAGERGNYAPSKKAAPQSLASLWGEYQQHTDNPTQAGFEDFARDKGINHRKTVREFYSNAMGHPARGRRRNTPTVAD
jgi:hypothetical protein